MYRYIDVLYIFYLVDVMLYFRVSKTTSNFREFQKVGRPFAPFNLKEKSWKIVYIDVEKGAKIESINKIQRNQWMHSIINIALISNTRLYYSVLKKKFQYKFKK